MSRTGTRYPDGRSVYACDTCGLQHPWSEDALWFGSLQDADDGTFKSFCSRSCAEMFASQFQRTVPSVPMTVKR